MYPDQSLYPYDSCLLYTSDAADDTPCVDLGGRRIIKKEDLDQHNNRGIYMRDDHCDWGSSGMNDLIKSLDDNN